MDYSQPAATSWGLALMSWLWRNRDQCVRGGSGGVRFATLYRRWSQTWQYIRHTHVIHIFRDTSLKPVKCPPVNPYGVNILKTQRLRDRWSTSMKLGTYIPWVEDTSRKRNFEFRFTCRVRKMTTHRTGVLIKQTVRSAANLGNDP